LTLVDGDVFQPRNRARQTVTRLGNKAQVTAEALAREFDRLSVRAIGEYVSDRNIAEVVPSGSVILLMVDNHATRRLVSEHCAALEDVVLLSGGNEFTDGSVQVFVRARGRNVTPPLTAFHPEIARPADQAPYELGCSRLIDAGEPQLLFTNVAIASALLNAFYTVVELASPAYDEVYVDIVRARMVPVSRKAD
jgi:molybdopterin/thiamine biosynthesis adenylyltransferase